MNQCENTVLTIKVLEFAARNRNQRLSRFSVNKYVYDEMERFLDVSSTILCILKSLAALALYASGCTGSIFMTKEKCVLDINFDY